MGRTFSKGWKLRSTLHLVVRLARYIEITVAERRR
jgi:hypothetical protein